MGGILSSVDVSISLQNEQGGFEAGSKVKGNAMLLVKKSFKVDGFHLAVEGRENTTVHYTTTETYTVNGQSHTRTKHHYAHSSRDVLRMTIPIGNTMVSSIMEVGSYDFPFEFELPPSLPSTMFATGGGGNCGIMYCLSVQGGGGSGSHKRPFVVKSVPLDVDPVPYISSPEAVTVNFCCCCNRGSMLCAANVMNTLVGKGDTIPLQFACENNSSADILGIFAEIDEKVVWTAQGRSNAQHRVISRIDLGSFIQDKAVLQKKEKTEIKDLSPTSSYQKLYKEISDDQGIALLQATYDMNDTYSGGVIHVTHELKLIVKTPNCVTDPTIIVPLRIGNKPLTKTGFVSSGPVYGAANIGSPAVPPALSPFPMNAGSSDQDGEIVVLSSAPPAGWSNAVVSSSVALPDPEISVGGYESSSTQTYTSAISFDSLLGEMERSLNDLDIVTTHSNDPDWDHILRSLTPIQFGELIRKVDLDHNQAKVGLALAENIKPFTSNHLIASIRTCSNWNRVNMVQKLLPLCEDARNGGAAKVKAELTEWEQTLTDSAFTTAL